MSKFQSLLLGFNNNVRHKNRVFHVQTEDSGVNRPHIITHLFMDGGRILKSVRKSYAEYVGTDGMDDVVREMMKDQHKAMITALREGEFDRLLNAGSDTKALAGSQTTTSSSPAAATTSKVPEGHANDFAYNHDAVLAASGSISLLRDSSPPVPGFRTEARARSVRGAKREEEPADAERIQAPSRKSDARTNAGRYTLAQGDVPTEPYRKPSSSSKTGAPSKSNASLRAAREHAARDHAGRYAKARPASTFDGVPQHSSSIFGDDLINDKSLDEVILSYLADDLDPPHRK
ncbi:MAG: hypothetical protein FWD69_14995 [Polyangiaceae bacterium]|nr:hypothetical protein [Polyangiaceae bacterium]